MTRWLPSPLVSVVLLLTWLLLNQSISPGDILLGAVLAIALPVLVSPMQPLGYPRLARPLVLFRLLSMALYEIMRSCFNVARIILFARAEGVRSQFIRVPLDLRNPYGLALLSCLINSTPGTVWVELLDTNELVLHVLDLHDEQWWIDTIKTRYEKPLIEVFERGKPSP